MAGERRVGSLTAYVDRVGPKLPAKAAIKPWSVLIHLLPIADITHKQELAIQWVLSTLRRSSSLKLFVEFDDQRISGVRTVAEVCIKGRSVPESSQTAETFFGVAQIRVPLPQGIFDR